MTQPCEQISPATAPGSREHYREVRARTEAIAAPLTVEDHVVQSMREASPTKWHLAHTSWFFETFLLARDPRYREFHPRFRWLFNSYYNAVGDQPERIRRGLSRPPLSLVQDYRRHVDGAMLALLESAPPDLRDVVVLGLHHEQQHQELILTDIKHVFGTDPLRPGYRPDLPAPRSHPVALELRPFPGGIHEIGHAGAGFAYDNESPRHEQLLRPYALANRLVTCGEYLEFMADGGYARPELWLSDGWATVKERGWHAPLYWEKDETGWRQLTLRGLEAVDPHLPACHVSFYEADAYARWRGLRLPSEAEWERAALTGSEGASGEGTVYESGPLQPQSAVEASGLRQMVGDVWEWTQSPYVAYPGYHPVAGALGEYNGKFMCNQMVLRGGSCVTPGSHLRLTYRNFFPPDARWQFSGIRLAHDLTD
ncbi:MAG: ergothioneine biosynthesis protein EgtB [Candidatus Eisenbacteria bacterium]|uniref:Ergothioneine biosynthesis protein EgtB n=1 Tax=Eiseniibacteriota bacterium TaxID=2212470 RepID=A0A956M163_UNCEI|nr:ergothioneine biosynthesis protein EgtB [Candidatus Eisenbacteria bacterium]